MPPKKLLRLLQGHLFDTGLINQVFDTLELHSSHAPIGGSSSADATIPDSKFSFNILLCDVRPNNLQGAQHSRVVIQLSGKNPAEIQSVAEEVCRMVSSHRSAEGTATILPSDPSQKPSEDASAVSGSMIQVTMPKRILLFGAGRVALPVAKYFKERHNTHLTVATESEEQARILIDTINGKADSSSAESGYTFHQQKQSRGRYVSYKYPKDNQPSSSSSASSRLAELIHHSDVVVSLLPATMHLPIAEECIRQKKDMVTASYVSPDMAKLHDVAKESGIIILNEVGLDPGMDHMMIMSAIDHIRGDLGADITELISLCGGLPDPITASMNPLKYKISWSPRGVLTAALNPARYMNSNEIIEIPGDDLLTKATYSQRFPTMRLEVVPNRDSLIYRSLYGLEGTSSLHSICRGTLRYQGWANAMYALKCLGLMSLQPASSLLPGVQSEDSISALEVVKRTLLQNNLPHDAHSVRQYLSRFPALEDLDAAMEAVQWLGLSGEGAGSVTTPHASSAVLQPKGQHEEALVRALVAHQAKGKTPLDALSSLWEQRLQYDMSATSNEKDMVAMYHCIAGRLPTGEIVRHQSRLLAFGDNNGDSAMAATVGYTTAAAIDLVLSERENTLKDVRGVVIPTDKRVYDFILRRIQEWGITWSESVTTEAPTSPKR